MNVDRRQLIPLVDADVLVYSCGFAADSQVKKEFLKDNPMATDEQIKEYLQRVDYTHYAIGNCKQILLDIQRLFRDDLRLFLTGSGNFRETLATILPYKGNRDPTHKPKYYREIQQYLREVWKAEIVHGREADDALSCTQWGSPEDTTVICSIDKDLDNTPGYHYNWRKGEFYYIDQEQADRLFFTQVLTGDKTDNIQGIPNVGPVKAKKILDGCVGWMDMVTAVDKAYVDYYKDQFQAQHAMYENASLLWMQRVEDINWDDQPYKYPQQWEQEYDERDQQREEVSTSDSELEGQGDGSGGASDVPWRTGS